MYKKIAQSILLFTVIALTNAVKAQDSDINSIGTLLQIYSGGTSGSPVTLTIDADITVSDALHFMTLTDSYINIEGNGFTITISNVSGYPGLFKVPIDGSLTNITISNLTIAVDNSTLVYGGGWITQTNFSNAVIDNCSSNGDISLYSGGIVGRYGTDITVKNSFATGAIDAFSGGIVGANSTDVTIENSYSTGSLGNQAGGIVGKTAIRTTVENAYSTGSHTVSRSGGIFGRDATDCSAINCYALAPYLSTTTGAIYGFNAVNSSVENCYLPSATSTSEALGTNGGSNTITNSGFGSGTWNDSGADSYLLGTDGSIWEDIDLGSSTVPYVLSSPVSTAPFTAFNDMTRTYFDQTYTITPPTSANTSPVTFASSNLAVATVSGNTVTITGIGITTITASQAADATYDSNSTTATLTIEGVAVTTKNGAISNTNFNYVNRNGLVGDTLGLNQYGASLEAKTYN